MNKNSLLEIFDINPSRKKNDMLTDYEIFKDKELLESLRKKIMDNLLNNNSLDSTDFTSSINDVISKTLEGYNLSNLERSHIFNLIDDEINGLGPLTQLLEDDNITEIMVNSPKDIYVEADGKVLKDNTVSFINDDHVLRTIQRLIGLVGETLSNEKPIIEVRLDDGSKINAVIPPISKNPVLTIKKVDRKIKGIDDLIRIGALTPDMARYLEGAIESKLNILICGGIGSGKSTLLNVLADLIDEDKRIIALENNSELKFINKNIVVLETKKTNYDNGLFISMQTLLNTAVNMHPDSIIIGEINGNEAYDYLQVMNSGYDSTLTTMYANDTLDALKRLENYARGGNPDALVSVIREYIANNIDLVIDIERVEDGKKKIISISEISLVDGNIRINNIFAFNQKGLTYNNEVNGEYVLVNKNALINQKMLSRGVDIKKLLDNQDKPNMPKVKKENRFISE